LASSLPDRILIREVGPRDGLQGERPLPPSERARLIEALVAAGLTHIEAVSFVSPRAVPAMAGAGEVIALVGKLPERSALTITALVPNLRGAQLALEAGVDELTVTVAASPTYNERNVGMSIADSLEAIAQIVALAAAPASPVPVDVVISCAFGSPYEGEIAPSEVVRLDSEVRAAGAAAVTLADTTGMATPRVLSEVVGETGPAVGLHLHETRSTGLLNLYAALGMGVVRFDSSVGGLGGSPFAEGAGGNVATEGIVALLDDIGVETGISIEKLLVAADIVEEMVGHAVPSAVAKAGPRTRLAPRRLDG
jgi:hydroxymethylglutaryl-CoA lyase